MTLSTIINITEYNGTYVYKQDNICINIHIHIIEHEKNGNISKTIENDISQCKNILADPIKFIIFMVSASIAFESGKLIVNHYLG